MRSSLLNKNFINDTSNFSKIACPKYFKSPKFNKRVCDK